MQTESIVESQPKAEADELIETLTAISIVAKKLANRVKLEKCQMEDKPYGKTQRIIIHIG